MEQTQEPIEEQIPIQRTRKRVHIVKLSGKVYDYLTKIKNNRPGHYSYDEIITELIKYRIEKGKETKNVDA